MGDKSQFEKEVFLKESTQKWKKNKYEIRDFKMKNYWNAIWEKNLDNTFDEWNSEWLDSIEGITQKAAERKTGNLNIKINK